MPSDIDITLEPVAQALRELQVRFYVCGSVASSAHVEMRATADMQKWAPEIGVADLLEKAWMNPV